MQQLQAAAERERDRDRRAGRDVRHREPRPGAGVIGGLLVRGEVDLRGERIGHARAVRADVAHLAPGEPQARGGGERQRREKDESEGVHDPVTGLTCRREL